jgi:hypothetical protein
LLDRALRFLDDELLIAMSTLFVVSAQIFFIVLEFRFRLDRVFTGEEQRFAGDKS